MVINNNILVNAGKPIDVKYLNTGNTSYSTISEVNSRFIVPERHIGMTVNIACTEFWYRTGVTDSDLVPKLSAVVLGNTITGATNAGFFSGMSGVQSLEMFTTSSLPVPNHLEYRGIYSSVLGFYYRDVNGFIRAGVSPVDSIPKRLYVKSALPVKSWIWNDGGAFDLGIGGRRGWFLMDDDASLRIGQQVILNNDGIDYYGTTGAYTNITWGNPPPAAGNRTAFITNVSGSLTTGTTVTLGSPIYVRNINNNTSLELRTIRSVTPSRLVVSFDDAFINLSGITMGAQNVGCSVGNVGHVFTSVNENTFGFRRLRGAGDTVVCTIGNDIVINSVGGGIGIAFADNGLTLSGNTVALGGILNSNVDINANNNILLISGLGNFSLRSNSNHQISFNGNAGFELSGNTFVFRDNSLVTKQYVDGIVYEVGAGDFIPLPPTPRHKDRVIIMDTSGAAESNPIVINGNGRMILNSNTAMINTNYGSITLYFNEFGFWSVVGFTN